MRLVATVIVLVPSAALDKCLDKRKMTSLASDWQRPFLMLPRHPEQTQTRNAVRFPFLLTEGKLLVHYCSVQNVQSTVYCIHYLQCILFASRYHSSVVVSLVFLGYLPYSMSFMRVIFIDNINHRYIQASIQRFSLLPFAAQVPYSGLYVSERRDSDLVSYADREREIHGVRN